MCFLRLFMLSCSLIIVNLSAMQPATPSTNEVLRIVQKWFTPENITSLGANGCMQKVELDLRNFTGSAATVTAASPQIQLTPEQSIAAVGALGAGFVQRVADLTGTVGHAFGVESQQLDLQRQPNANDERMRALQDLLARDQAIVKMGNDSMLGLAMIAGALGKNQMARQLTSTGACAMKFVENSLLINSIPTQIAAGTLLESGASVVAAGGWVGIAVAMVGMITSFMNDDGGQGEAFEAIFHALQQLSRQMHQYHEATMRAFSGLHDHLHAQDKFMLENFFELRTGQQDIKTKLRNMSRIARRMNYALRGNVHYVADLLQSQQVFITGNLESLRTEGILDLVEEVEQASKSQTVATQSFKDYATKLMVKGVNRANGPYVTGDSVDVTSPQAVCLAVPASDVRSNLWAHPVFANVNLMRNYSVRNWQLQSPTPIVNPLIWTKIAQALATLFSKKLTDPQYPDSQHTKQLDLELIEKVEQAGRRFAEFVQACGAKVDLIGQAFGNSVDELSAQVQQEVTAHEAARSLELQREVSRKIESEIAQFHSSAASCPTVVKVTNEAVEVLSSQANHLKTRSGKKFEGQLYLFSNHIDSSFHYRANQLVEGFKKNALVEVCQTKKTPMNYDAYLVQEKKIHCEMAQKKANDLLPLCGVSITKDVSAVVATNANYNSMSKIIYPKPGCGYTVPLPLPYGKDFSLLFMPYKAGEQYEILMEKLKKYAVMEQQGIGIITYEYEPIHGFFYLRAFFNFKSGAQKDIFTFKVAFEQESLYPKNSDENLLAWWYGGRYPKSQYDKIDMSNFVLARDFVKKHNIKRNRNGYIGAACYYPAIESYRGSKDDLFALAPDTAFNVVEPNDQFVSAHTALVQAKERVQFNNALKAKLQPSTTSSSYKALQNMDMQHKLLDCLLALVYNENMFANTNLRPEFAEFYTTNSSHLYDLKSMHKYLEDYSASESPLPLKPYELTQLLQLTKAAKLQALQRIKQLNLTPQFARVTSAVQRLSQLRQLYSQRVDPVPPATAAAAAVSSAVTATLQNTDVAALQADNQRLRDQVNSLAQQMETMLRMLQAMAPVRSAATY